MLTVIYGTSNPGKIKQIQSLLAQYNITLRGTYEFGVDLDVPEDGKTSEENAAKKAAAYAAAIQKPVLSMDSALYFKGVPDELQPGVYVRRFGGNERANDQELLDYYREFVARYGGKLDGYWETAFALGLPDGTHRTHLVHSPRIFVSETHATVPTGNPLMAMQVDPVTGKHLPDLTPKERIQTAYSYVADLAAFLHKTHPAP
jgi:XTP/dITP diphosphohydrolase